MAAPLRKGQRVQVNDRLTVIVTKVRDDGNTVDAEFETAEIRMTRAEYAALSERARANIEDVVLLIEGEN